MRWTGVALAACVLCGGAGRLRAEASFGENLVEVKLSLTQTEPFLRGATDPVAGLVAQVTLTNRTRKENLSKESIAVETVAPMTWDEVNAMKKLSPEARAAELEKRKSTQTVEVQPINKDSLGVAYVAPSLATPDSIDLVIHKLPPEGQPDAKPVRILRREMTDHVSSLDVAPTQYLAAGETSPAYPLPVGKYYLIRDPGWYSIKAVIALIGDSEKAAKFAESNEEKFQVLPLKVVDQKIDQVQANFTFYEHGMPGYDYMLYQVKTAAGYDEVYSVQRISVRGFDRFEWKRICTVREGATAQVAQVGPKKIALYAMQAKGDAGLYMLDFSAPGPVVKVTAAKDGGKLKVEGDTVSVE